jgi:transposase
MGLQLASLGLPSASMSGPGRPCVPASNRCRRHARSLRQHRELILNYFRAQKLLSSGVVGGLNNKAKVTIRKSYGFRSYNVLELALYRSLGKLPEPESTHDFF